MINQLDISSTSNSDSEYESYLDIFAKNINFQPINSPALSADTEIITNYFQVNPYPSETFPRSRTETKLLMIGVN